MLAFPPPEAPALLVIDADPAAAAALRTSLVAAGYAVAVAPDGVAGLLLVEQLQPAVVLVAWDLPFLTGAIVAQALQVGLDHPPLVVALAATIEQDPPAVGDGIAAILPRHPTVDDVLMVIRTLLPPPARAHTS